MASTPLPVDPHGVPGEGIENATRLVDDKEESYAGDSLSVDNEEEEPYEGEPLRVSSDEHPTRETTPVCHDDARPGDEEGAPPGASTDRLSANGSERRSRPRREDSPNVAEPTPIVHGTPSAEGLMFDVDIDSVVAASRSLEPFRCRVQAKISTKPSAILISKNTKLTKYLEHRFKAQRRPAYRNGYRENAKEKITWYEFSIGTIDSANVFVLFQIAENSYVYKDVPRTSTTHEEGRLRKACSAFILNILTPAVRRLTTMSETAMTGLKYLVYDVDRVYNVVQRDYDCFARSVSTLLETTNLSDVCGMRYVRFYMANHGLRLERHVAKRYVNELVDLDHAHLDVMQIHKANSLILNDGTYDAIVVKLWGHGQRSLEAIFKGAIKISPKLQRFRTGFLENFGYFCQHVSPKIRNRVITYAQAYNAAAKMARPTDSGFLPTFVLCRGYEEANNSLKRIRNEALQHMHDMLQFYKHYVHTDHTLRIEEVQTFDSLRCDGISSEIERQRVFEDDLCIMTVELLNREVLHRVCNWRRHVQASIGADIAFLRSVLKSRRLLDATA